MQERTEFEQRQAERQAKADASEAKVEMVLEALAGLAAGTHGFKMVNGVYVIVPCEPQ